MPSNADGNGTWQDPSGGVPYGTIVMWFNTTIPTGWLVCKDYNTLTSGNQEQVAQIFIDGSYRDIPILVNSLIMGGTTFEKGGNTSPKVAQTSGVKFDVGGNSGAYTYTYTQVGDPTAISTKYKGVLQVGLYGATNFVATQGNGLWASVLQPTNGYGGDPGMLLTNTGVPNYAQLIFIVKYNPNASFGQPGHYLISTRTIGQQQEYVQDLYV